MRLWPATPVKPVLAFTFDLLDSLEALLLECQVATKDFVEALKLTSDYPPGQVSKYHNNLI